MNILIIGKNSYIGNHINEWLNQHNHQVSQLDVLTDEWKTFDYSKYDSIIHVAGIVHQPKCKDWELFKKVNADMPVAIASLAKQQGVKQYVFFSTMAVYGQGKKLSGNVIDENTTVNGCSYYGKSKMMAEEGLTQLQDYNFIVSIVRPPSVYGKGCKGGYITGFKRIVTYFPVLPEAYHNARQSFVYIDNLSECVSLIIENKLKGVFCPQDDIAPNANELFKAISQGLKKKYFGSRIFGLILSLFGWMPLVKKVYGGIEYSRQLSTIDGFTYTVVDFFEGIRRTLDM